MMAFDSVLPGGRRFLGTGLILLAAAVAIAPQLLHGNSCGHDFDFHLVSWLDALHTWRQGIFYPHWTPSPNFGAGEPRFLFYPPLSWMLGAAMGAILPWVDVPIALTFLILAATGLATRSLARLILEDGPATLAGSAAVFSGYALFTAYERSAFAEMTGGFWIPLILLLVLRDPRPAAATTKAPSLWRRSFDGSAMPLALLIAGAWISNAPLGVMASYLLAAVAAVVAILSRSWAPLLRAAVGELLGMGLAAFYLVPAAWEQRWVDIRQATDDPGLLIENSWLFARHADPLLKLHDDELFKVSIIAVSMIALSLLALLVIWRRGKLPPRRIWVPLALIPAAILFLQFPASLPVWDAFPKLRFLQFPWRWLVALEAPMGIFMATALSTTARRNKFAVIAAFSVAFVAAAIAARIFYFQKCYPEDAVPAMLGVYTSGSGFEGTDEYAPPGADDTLVATGMPGACLVKDPTTLLGAGDPDSNPQWSPGQGTCDAIFPLQHVSRKPDAEHLRVEAAIPHAGYLILRLRMYPAWNVRLNGRRVAAMPQRQDGMIAVPVSGGPADLTIDWTTTRDVLAGRWISMAALILVIGLGVSERRPARPRLS